MLYSLAINLYSVAISLAICVNSLLNNIQVGIYIQYIIYSETQK